MVELSRTEDRSQITNDWFTHSLLLIYLFIKFFGRKTFTKGTHH